MGLGSALRSIRKRRGPKPKRTPSIPTRLMHPGQWEELSAEGLNRVRARIVSMSTRFPCRPTEGGQEMDSGKSTMFKTVVTGTLVMALLGMVLVSRASAGCGSFEGPKAGAIQPQSWQGPAQFSPVSFVLVAENQHRGGN